MKKLLFEFFFPPNIKQLKKRYIEKNGYPKETVILGDIYGNLGAITGSEIYKKHLNGR